MFRVGHLSDLHATPVRIRDPRELAGKRLLGWLSWHVRRQRAHQPAVLEALIEDLHRVAPDQVVVTGDLTNVSCEHEFVAGARVARAHRSARIGVDRAGQSRRLREDPARGLLGSLVGLPALDPPTDASAGARDEFPTLRLRGPAAFIGLSTAQPTALGLATGSLGGAQLGGSSACSPVCATPHSVGSCCCTIRRPPARSRRAASSPTPKRCAACCGAPAWTWCCTATAIAR